MADAFSLVWAHPHDLDGSDKTTIKNLADGTVWVPEAETWSVQGDPNRPAEATVVRTLKLRVQGASKQAVLDEIGTVQRALSLDGPRRQRYGRGPALWFYWTPDGSTTEYRTEVLTGALDIEAKTFPYGLLQNKAFVTLRVETFNFWERSTAKTIEWEDMIDARTGLAFTSGSVLRNASDANYTNAFRLAAADCLGTLPSPIVYARGAMRSNGYRKYVSIVPGEITNTLYQLQAERATRDGTVASGTATVDANAAGGNVVQVTNVPNAWTTAFRWTTSRIPDEAFTGAGRYRVSGVRVLLWFAPSHAPSNGTCQVKLRYTLQTGAASYVETPVTTMESGVQLHDCGVLPIHVLPPMLPDTYAQLQLWLKDSGAACDFRLDFIQLMPVYSHVVFIQEDNTDNIEYVYLDPEIGLVGYGSTDGSFTRGYGQLFITPGVENTFLVLTGDEVANPITNPTWWWLGDPDLAYYPRYLTV